MFKFLTTDAESKRVSQLPEQIRNATDKIKFYTKQVVNDVGADKTELSLEMYGIILDSKIMHELSIWEIHVTPYKIIENETIYDLCEHMISIDDKGEDNEEISIIR